MLRVQFILVAVATCCVATCLSASVVEATQHNARILGTMNSYYVSTWARFISGADMTPVANTAAAIGALDFLTGAEPVTVVVHGRASSAFDAMAIALKNSLISSDPTMAVVFVDWSWVSSQPYSQVVSSVMPVAQDLSAFIAQMVTSTKLTLTNLHIVGFDVGAHIAGVTSRIAASRAQKLTALDPAAEGFSGSILRLQQSDAGYVEVIHTDCIGARAYGIYDAIGHIDFYPNGGTRQPGCAAADNLCHHNRAWQLFAATVDLNGHLVGLKCDTMAQMTSNRCVGIPHAAMGSTILFKIAVGIYRVNTGNQWPYTA